MKIRKNPIEESIKVVRLIVLDAVQVLFSQTLRESILVLKDGRGRSNNHLLLHFQFPRKRIKSDWSSRLNVTRC